jgi:hypothetical protein
MFENFSPRVHAKGTSKFYKQIMKSELNDIFHYFFIYHLSLQPMTVFLNALITTKSTECFRIGIYAIIECLKSKANLINKLGLEDK